MNEPTTPAAEVARLNALRRAEILDSEPEPAFDDMARLAMTLCQTPMAFISLVDDRRAWFKAKIGIDVAQLPLEESFCSHVVAAGQPLVVPDALADPRFHDLVLVRDPPHVRFYAGVPIQTPDRQAIGTLSVLDVEPRQPGPDQIAALSNLARQVAMQIQFRRWAVDVASSVQDAWTARIQIEIERALLRGVLRAATEYSIVGTDPSGTITVFNEGAERMLGYAAAEVIGRATPVILHDKEELARRASELGGLPGFETFVGAARRGEAETREWTYVRKDGGRIPVSLTVTAMREVSGMLTGFIGIARDLTSERRAEQERARFLVERAAREAAEHAVDRLSRLNAVCSALASSVTRAEVLDVILRHGLRALGARSGAVALLGGEGTLQIVATSGAQPDAPASGASFPLATACPLGDAIRSRALVFRDENVAAPLLLDGQPLGALIFGFAEPRAYGEEDRIFLLTLCRQCASALERARLYEAEAHARAESEAANQAKDQFLSVLSHELRSPLTAVMGWVHILRSRPRDDATRDRGLAIIERNAAAQLRLIEDILDTSLIVAGQMRVRRDPVDLAELVRGAVDEARPAVEAAGLTIVSLADPALGPVIGDGERLARVARNLLSNAVKFTPRGGRIEVRLDREEERARLRVSDTGAGIAPDFLPHIFDRFRQADSGLRRAYGGLGLGLGIARHVIELHGGTIVVESAGVDRGTSITIRLPLAAAEADGRSAA